MTTVIVCPDCQRKLRIPEAALETSFRCPACKTLIAPDAEPESPSASRSVQRTPSPRTESVPSRGRPPREEEPEDDLEPEAERPIRKKPAGKKRPASKKSAAGLIIGLAVGGVFLLILFVGIGVGLFRYFNRSRTIPESEWQSFSPPNSGCIVLMPGTPVFQSQTQNGLTTNAYGVERDKGKTGFGVTFMNLNPDPLKPKALELGKKAMHDQLMQRTNGKATIKSETPITLAGIPGYEFQAALPGGGTFIDRFYLAKIDGTHRFYTVFVLSDTIPLDKDAAARFLDSFKLDASAQPPTFGNAAASGRPNPPQANPQPNPPAGIRKPRSPRRQRP